MLDVLAVNFIVESLQTGLLDIATGITGVESTITETFVGLDVHELIVSVTL